MEKKPKSIKFQSPGLGFFFLCVVPRWEELKLDEPHHYYYFRAFYRKKRDFFSPGLNILGFSQIIFKEQIPSVGMKRIGLVEGSLLLVL